MTGVSARQPFRRFESVETEIVWAAVERLDVAAKHALLDELANELFVEPHLRKAGPATREARAVLALREAAAILGHSPSINEYIELSGQHRENRWPHPSRIRRWLGSNSWNRALERAGLESVTTDAIIRERRGSNFTDDQLIEALRLAGEEFGGAPTFEEYNHWARRPDIVAKHGLVPRSVATFISAFGSWTGACIAAGLRDSEVLITKRGVVRYAAHAYEQAEAIEALQFAATKIGRTPTVGEYNELRKIVQAGASDSDRRTLPSVTVIKRLLERDWDKACLAAGLEDPGKSVSAPFSDEELIGFAVEALEEGFDTAASYETWRSELRRKAEEAGQKPRRLASAVAIRKRLGGWQRVRARAEEILAARP